MIGERRVRIVLDREGWSRELFRDLLRLNFDFATYRKDLSGDLGSVAFGGGRACPTGEVHLEQLSAPRYNWTMQSLCQPLNALSPRLPETD